jgi:hypothetical protein
MIYRLKMFHLAKGGNPRAQAIFESVGIALGTAGYSDQHFQFPLYLWAA